MSEELSRVEDLLENGVEQPVLPMSELEAILRGEKIKPHSRVAELLLQYNPQDILIEKSITENGTYYASVDNADGYFKVIVDTPVVPPVVLDHLVETITQNGTYNYTSEHDGYSDAEITVNVPKPQPVVASKTITANGTYVAADEQLDGYSQAVVNVPATPLDTMNITHNGTYHPPTGRGFDEVNVAVPLGSKSITANGTYVATDDNLDGYSSVAVDVPQIGIKDIPNTPTPIATFSDGTDNPLKSLTASIVPVQSGSGDPSPTNVRPITGWTEANVWNGGKNYLNTIQDNVVMVNGWEAPPVISNQSITYNIPEGAYFFLLKAFKIEKCHVGKTYVMSYNISPDRAGYTKFVICNADGGGRQEKALTATITNADVGKLLTVRFYPNREGNYTITNIQVEEGSEPTTYEPYAGTTTTIPFTDGQGQSHECFGGTFGVVNGSLDENQFCYKVTSDTSITKSGNYFEINNVLPEDATANYQFIASFCKRTETSLAYMIDGEGRFVTDRRYLAVKLPYSTVEEVKTYLTSINAQIVYTLPTSTTLQQQPTSIKSLDGENNVFASTGEILSGQYFGYVYPELGTKTITENGTYDPADDGLDGYSEVNVTIPLGTKTITENGTYTATDDNLDGYSQVTINVAGGGGETKYYEYIRALNGQIIVRVEYPDAERTYATKTLWFFNGYDTDSSDKDIPSILIPYLPKNWSTDVMLTSGYTDNTSATQLGWVGFLYPNRTPPSTKIRTWNISKGGLQSGSFWGVLDISGPEEQITEWFDPYENVPPRQIKNYGGTIEDGYNLNTDLKDLGNVYHDSAMSYEIDNDSFDITWNESGAYIGFSFNGDVDLKASDIQRLSYKIDFGTCYDAAWNQNIRPFVIGVTDTIRTTPSTGIYFDPSNVDQYFTKYKMYYKDVCNTTVEDFVDISDIEGPCYLFIVATGWIASITDLSMISNSTPQIGTTLSQFNFFNYVSEDSNANKIIPIDTESFDVYWSGAIYIGHCLTGAIPLSGKKRLDIDMDYIGENYQHNSGTHTRNHNLAIVVTDIKVDSYVNLDNLERDNHIIAIKEWDGNDIYGQSIHTSIDLSNISGEYYINYQLPGFNIDGFKARLYSINAILPKYPNKVILNNKPIQNDQGSWITYNFDTPLTVGKSYLIMWSSGKSVDTYPFATAFTLTNSSASVSLTAHGVTATLSISTTSLVGTYSNDYDTRLRHINLLEIPSEFSDGLIY